MLNNVSLLSKAHALVFKEIYSNEDGKYYLQTLSNKLKKDKSQISRLLINLEEDGLIDRREETGEKGRKKTIYHTDRGQLLYSILYDPPISKIDETIERLFIETGEIPTDKEVAIKMEVAMREVDNMIIIEKRIYRFMNSIEQLKKDIQGSNLNVLKKNGGDTLKDTLLNIKAKKMFTNEKNAEKIIDLLIKKYIASKQSGFQLRA